MDRDSYSRAATIGSSGRNLRLVVGVGSALATKAVTFSLTLLIVPLTLGYLGPEKYGVWVTMISLMAWVSMVDLGLLNGLLPALSSAIGKDRFDLAHQYVASSFWGLFAISILSIVLMVILWPLIDWGSIFNVDSPSFEQEISTAMALAIGIFFLTMLLSITKQILLAHQEGAKANLWQLLISISSVTGLYLVTRTEGGLPSLVVGFSGAQALVLFASAIWLFSCAKPHLHPFIRPKWMEAKYVFSLGGMFAVNQLATLVIYQKDNIFITQIWGPEAVTAFSVTWQMFLYLNFINLLVAPYLGPGYGEAYSRGDLGWMKKAFTRHVLISTAATSFAVLLMVLFYRQTIPMWLGTAEILPSKGTVLWIGAFTILMSIQGPIIALLNGVGRLKVFTIAYSVSTLFNLGLTLVLIRHVGVYGGVLASVISIAAIVIAPSLFEVRRALRAQRHVNSIG